MDYPCKYGFTVLQPSHIFLHLYSSEIVTIHVSTQLGVKGRKTLALDLVTLFLLAAFYMYIIPKCLYVVTFWWPKYTLQFAFKNSSPLHLFSATATRYCHGNLPAIMEGSRRYNQSRTKSSIFIYMYIFIYIVACRDYDIKYVMKTILLKKSRI